MSFAANHQPPSTTQLDYTELLRAPLPAGIGQCEYVDDMSDDEIERAFARLEAFMETQPQTSWDISKSFAAGCAPPAPAVSSRRQLRMLHASSRMLHASSRMLFCFRMRASSPASRSALAGTRMREHGGEIMRSRGDGSAARRGAV